MKLIILIVLILCYLSSCQTPTLTTVGPKWQLRGQCEMKAKSNDWYASIEPETKCGAVLEVTIVQGGK